MRPGQIADQFAPADRLPIFHEPIIDLIAVDEMPKVPAPQAFHGLGAKRLGLGGEGFGGRLVAGQCRKPRNRAGIGEHVTVDRGAERIAAAKTVLAAAGVDGGDRILGRIEQRFDPIKPLGGIVTIVPLGINPLHRRQMPRHRRKIAVDQKTLVGGVGYGFRKMPVVSAFEHVVDIVAGIAAIAQPAPFQDVKAGGVVQAGPRLQLPADVVEKFGRNKAARTQIALMGAGDLPAVIIDPVEQRVGGFEERNVVLEPRRIVAESCLGDLVLIERRLRCRMGGRHRKQGGDHAVRQEQPSDPLEVHHAFSLLWIPDVPQAHAFRRPADLAELIRHNKSPTSSSAEPRGQAARGIRLKSGGTKKSQPETHHKFAILADTNRHVVGFE